MANYRQILNSYQLLIQQQKSGVLATILRTEGSTYRKAGARMLISEDGELSGLISGGCLEGNLLTEARKVLASGKSAIVTYDMRADEEGVWGYALGCNGLVDLLLEPLLSPGSNALDWIQRCYSERKPLRLITGLPPLGDALVAYFDAEIYCSSTSTDSFIDLLPASTDAERHQIITKEETRYFVETILPPPHLLLLGAGSDCQPIVALAHSLGWEVTVVDHRASHIARAARWCEAPLKQLTPQTLAAHIELSQVTAAIVISHHFPSDADYLRQLLPTAMPYIAVLGPAIRTDRLLEQIGMHPERGRIHTPAGLDLGAESPEEIALSIISEIQAVLTGSSGCPLHLKTRGIHE